MQVQSKINAGFTLIEAVIVLFLFSFVAAVSLESYQVYRGKNDLYLARLEIITALRRAAVQSTAVSGDSAWGVNFSNRQITIFQGNNFNSRNPGFDETHSLPGRVAVDLSGDVIFNKFTGTLASPVVINLSSDNSHAQVQINAKGFIAY